MKSEVLKAEIEPAAPGGGAPMGLVIFEFHGKAITGVYGGDANFEASTMTAPKLSKRGVAGVKGPFAEST